MDGAMGPEDDVVEAVLTCEGDFHDPELHNRIERFRHRLKDLLLTEKKKVQVKKVEPWNSVKVTFTIPREAALRLQQLAQAGSDDLRRIGVLSVQIQGDSQISLTLAGRNNEPTQIVLRTPRASGEVPSPALPAIAGVESGLASSDELGNSPGPSHDEVTKKNIAEYLRQGPQVKHNAVLDSILGAGVSASGIGMGLGNPSSSDTFPAPPGRTSNSPPFRPNMVNMHGQKIRGSQASSNSFQFSKTTGAFHPPVPRLTASAGQSTNTITSTHHIQSFGSSAAGPASCVSVEQQQLVDFANGLAGPINSFPATGGPPRLSPLASSMMMDLPPPPPYPHSSASNSKPGQPVTASSPLLVNLLQTDPIAASAGMASGNSDKPLKAGDPSTGPPVKKKRRAKKAKDGLMKPVSLTDAAVSSAHSAKPVAYQGVTPLGLPGETGPRMPTSPMVSKGAFGMDFVQSRAGAVPINHIPDSFVTNFRPENRVSFPSERPLGESAVDTPLSSSGLRPVPSVRSAIARGASSLSDTNGQDMDPFSSEITAGKIVNPYTGQLEPRDSVLESNHLRLKGQANNSQEDNLTAAQIMTKKAKVLEETKKSVPISTSQMLDINVYRSFPSSSSVTASTAALMSSGGPSMADDRLVSSVPSYRRNLISDGSHSDKLDGPPQSSIYAGNSSVWQNVVGNGVTNIVSLPGSLANPLPQQLPVSMETGPTKSFAGVNGPVPDVHFLKHKTEHLQPGSCASSSLSSSSSPSLSSPLSSSPLLPSGSSEPPPKGSVIYSSVTSSPPVNVHLSRGPSMACLPSHPSATLPSSSLQTSPSPTSVPLHSLPRVSSSPAVPVTDRLKHTDSNHTFSNQQNQAASNESLGNSCTTSSPTLLNSVPEKHLDSHSNTASPTDNKLPSEGDENSNHSVSNTDNLPESSGTNALLEHSGVKSENHDSGIGSSSERSDDTPSEPGDGEFRSAQAGGETEESNSKPSAQKDFKVESKVDSASTTITVGYMMSPSEPHLKSSLAKESSEPVKMPSQMSKSGLPQFLDSHLKSLEKPELLSGSQRVSPGAWATELNKEPHANHLGQCKQNGPPLDVANYSLMNGPSSQALDKMIMDMNELQQKKGLIPKHPASKKESQGESSFPPDMLEMAKLQQHFGETSKESLEALRYNSLDSKAVSPETLLQGLGESRPDQLSFYDMDELVVGKMMASSNGGEGKGGSNITSIYSKRSSPVNVNMLNHIYSPGLPLPRRLTESVQRLVKPLPASESSMPPMRPCKSPGSGGSPRAGSMNGQGHSRVSVHSGARSPGASLPKLIPNDKHSLLSERLDLAGLSGMHYTSAHKATDQGLTNCSRALDQSPMSTEAILKDLHQSSLPFLSNAHHSPPGLLDSKSHRHSSKLLSQSFPPHKSRDLSNVATLNTNSLSHLHSGQFDRKSSGSPPLFPHHSSVRSLSVEALSSGKSPVGSSMPALYTSELDSSQPCSSPSMPVLQQGAEPPTTPTLAFSSQSPQRGSSLGGPPLLSSSKAGGPAIPAPTPHVPYSSPPASVAAGDMAKSLISSVASSLQVTGTPPKLSKVLNTSSTPTSPRTTPGSNRNLFESVTGSFVHDLPKSEGQVNSCDKPPISSTCTNGISVINSGDPVNSVLVSMDSESNLTVRNVRHKGRELDLSASVEKSRVKTVQVGDKSPGIATEVVNLDFSTSQLPSLNSLSSISGKNDLLLNPLKQSKFPCSVLGLDVPKAVSSMSVCASSTVVSSSMSSVSDSRREASDVIVSASRNAAPTEKNTPTPVALDNSVPISVSIEKSAPTSVSKEKSSPTPMSIEKSTSSNTPISIERSASSTTSVSIDKSALSSSVVSVSSRSTPITAPVCVERNPAATKEPILETLANSLASSKPAFPDKPSVASKASVLSDEVKPKPTDSTKVPPVVSESKGSSGTPQTPEPPAVEDSSEKRMTRKRKLTTSESDSHDGAKEEAPPPKKQHTSGGTSSTPPVVNSQPADGDKDNPGSKPPLASVTVATPRKEHTEPSTRPAKPSTSHKEEGDASNRPPSPQQPFVWEEEVSKAAKCETPSVQSNNGETTSEESAAHHGTASDSKEGRFHRTSTSSEGKDKQPLANSTPMPDEDKDKKPSTNQEEPSHDTKVAPHKDSSPKDLGKSSHNVFTSLTKREEEKRPHPPVKEDKDKTKEVMAGDKAVPEPERDSENRFDGDPSKKPSRMKRQFYTYVPEKLIDQTYFDTPILTGRTRSKNKPADGHPSESGHGSVAPAPSQEGPSATSGTSEAQAAAESGKRSTRSHKVKDVGQEQAASKRRRVAPRDTR